MVDISLIPISLSRSLLKNKLLYKGLSHSNISMFQSIVIGELYYGAYKSQRFALNIARIDVFATTVAILACEMATARLYGAIKNELRAVGKPIPENDIWMAALAQQHALTLATGDAHFSFIQGLNVDIW